LGLKFLGYYDDRPDERTADLPKKAEHKLGKLDRLVESAKAGGVEVIFITLPMRAEERIREIIRELADSTVSVYIVPDLFVFQLLHSRWSDVQGVPVVSVFENPFYGVDGILKRAVDLVLASFLMLLAAIPMALIALAVKLTSAGPVLFRQLRYGLDGKEILVWKFRTMTVCEQGSEVVQATRNDSRLTPIGGILRRSSLDELPQLFNVLLGQMSLVGPRPHANCHNEFYRTQIEGYMLRHKVKPGITGLAQINGCRGETETLDKMENRISFDHQYIREWTIWLDLKILLKTFGVVFSREGAY
jgi:putative colanic acid biosynthesis UDP-glucose lipid carrier transferase